MINYNTETIDAKIKSITCDCCRKTFSDVLDKQEFTHVNDIGGYNSAIGDGVCYQCDLCSNCVNDLLGKYLRRE